MKKESKINLIAALCLLAAFSLWTALLCVADVQAVGPEGTSVGFATINQAFHQLTGVRMGLYNITDWLGLIPIGIVAGFALFGAGQWVKRKRLRDVDYSLLVLGGFYIAVMAAYVLFENVVINYRPVLIDDVLEVSYPSSTTMLAMCVMPTAMMQLNSRIKNKTCKGCVRLLTVAFTVFMVAGRLISGVHWVTDILGGVLLSAGLVMLYRFVISLKK